MWMSEEMEVHMKLKCSVIQTGRVAKSPDDLHPGLIFVNSCCVHSHSRAQMSIALSSMEAEILAAISAGGRNSVETDASIPSW